MQHQLYTRRGFTQNVAHKNCHADNRKGFTHRCSRGFTLIELLVVVLIIGILAAVAMPQYTFAVEKARLSEALTVVNSLEKAIDVWLLEHGTPTKQIVFLGDNANGKGQLDIDIESSMDCSGSVWGPTNITCSSKNFSYSARCTDDTCEVFAYRVVNGNHIPYALMHQMRSADNLWPGDKECDYYPDESPVGEKICKMLEAQDGYWACEDC